MNPSFPQFSTTAQQGERGVNAVASITFEVFGWIFKRNHQEHDFGIDGQMEVVSPDGQVTGQMIAVQVKSGSSFFKEKTPLGYVYRGEAKHFNYLANYPLPVLLVIVHPESRKCHWVRFDPTQTQSTGSTWKITIPAKSDLSLDRQKIEALLPPLRDHSAELQKYWAVNSILEQSDYIHFVIDRTEIKARNFQNPRLFFDRLRSTRELALATQGSVEISICGYDKDKRELFEIPEVRTYLVRLAKLLPELFYFVRKDQPTSTVRLFALCHTKVSFPEGRSTALVTRRVEYENKPVGEFMMQGWPGLNMMTEWLDLPIEENKRISFGIARLLGVPEEAFTEEEPPHEA